MIDSVDHQAGPRTSAVELLAKTPLFGVLHPEDLKELAQTTRTRLYDRGDIIFRKDDPGFTLYVIINGAVKISVSSSEGDEIILAILTKGQFFGEMALFDEQPRSADAEAIQPTEVLAVQRKDLIPLLEQRQRIAINQLLKLLAQRLRATDELL